MSAGTGSARWRADLPAERAVNRILVLKWSALGDVVIATAAMQDIVDAFPAAEVHLNTLPPWQHLFAADGRFSRIVTVDVRGRERGPRGWWRWLSRIRAARYDVVFDLQSTDHTRALLGALRLSGAAPRCLVGYHRRWPYDVAPPRLEQPVHAHEYARAALAAAGVPTRAERPVLAVPPARREAVRALLEAHGLRPGHYAVLLAGCQAAGYLKRWGAERYARLAALLVERGVDRVVLLGGPDEMDECERIERLCGDWLVNLCGRTEILDLVPICEGAQSVVANDTGTAHVASATGRPMCVVCGPTDPRRVRPLGAAVRVVQADLPCINCYRKHCAHHSCMRVVAPQRVLAALDRPAGRA